jgi:hypothetical protein
MKKKTEHSRSNAMKPGPKPRPVYVNGRFFASVIAARIELGALTGGKFYEFSRALKDGTPFRGKTVSLYPPRAKGVTLERIRERGAALLRGHETHRIGHYVDSRW